MSLLKTKVNRLLLKFKNGDIKAYSELYELTFYRLYGVAFSYLKSKADCEDVVEESLLIVWQKIDLFDENKDGYNWLCKIVENKSKDKLRSINARKKVGEYIETQDEFEIAETKCDLLRLLDFLDEYEYKLIFERYFLDKTLKEIGFEFGLTIKQVHQRINKIIKKLQKKGKNISRKL